MCKKGEKRRGEYVLEVMIDPVRLSDVGSVCALLKITATKGLEKDNLPYGELGGGGAGGGTGERRCLGEIFLVIGSCPKSGGGGGVREVIWMNLEEFKRAKKVAVGGGGNRRGR